MFELCESCYWFGKECNGGGVKEQLCLTNPHMSLYLYREKEPSTPIIPRPDNSGDNVNHPNHYTKGGIECIKAIEASMDPSGFQDYCKGNVLKYIWRWREKNGLEDLKKAQVYLGWLIESVEKENKNKEDNNG